MNTLTCYQNSTSVLCFQTRKINNATETEVHFRWIFQHIRRYVCSPHWIGRDGQLHGCPFELLWLLRMVGCSTSNWWQQICESKTSLVSTVEENEFQVSKRALTQRNCKRRHRLGRGPWHSPWQLGKCTTSCRFHPWR